MKKIGYARVSTEEQNLNLQIDALRHAGCTRIYREKKSGSSRKRPQLDAALAALRSGDTLVVWKLDRLGRSFRHLVDVIEDLEEQGKGFVSISDGIDTTTATGRLVCRIISAIADFERSLIVERTCAGMQAAKRRGAVLGRPRVLSKQQIERAAQMSRSGHQSIPDLARRFKVGQSTMRRAIASGARLSAS